jgi:hypothetical protein
MPPAIQKITVGYDEQEDRLHLACEDAAGGVTALWLPQRLANRLVRALVAHLEGETEDRAMQDMLQAWHLSAAQAQQVPTAPVQGGTAPCLVHSIDIGLLPNALQLSFRSAHGEAVVLGLDMTALRQWLAILHQHYAKAEWPCRGIWPEWFDAARETAAVPAAGAILH